MKRLLFFVFTMMFAVNSFSATSVTLLLKGTITPILSISIVPEAIALALPLDTTQSETKIATITENSNSSLGYKITLSSLNNGKLKRTGGTEEIAYIIKYGTQGGLNLLSPQEVTYSNTQAVNTTKDVRISYTGVSSSQPAGDYEDSITLTIAVN